VEISDDTLAWQELLDIEPGGNYMEHTHTLQHCRDALQTKLFRSQTKDTWIAEGKKDLYARALDEYNNLKKHFKPVELAPEVNRELENIVKQADKDLANR
jgi:trimethylamine--corrinoid protein Co-methyltransferase